MGRRGWAIAAVAVVVVALGLYFLGRYQERSRGESYRRTLGSEITGLSADLEQVRAELAAERDETALLRARALLFETALDLERRNFGTANTRLDQAAEHLASVTGPAAGPRVDSLRAEIAGMDLRVAADLAGQRTRILGLAARLDSVIPAGER